LSYSLNFTEISGQTPPEEKKTRYAENLEFQKLIGKISNDNSKE